MNLDPKLVAKAVEISNQIVDMLKNQKTELAFLGLLAAVAVVRRKTTFTVDEVVDRIKAVEGIVDVAELIRKMSGRGKPA